MVEQNEYDGRTINRKSLRLLSTVLAILQIVVTLSMSICLAQYHYLEVQRNRLKNPLKAHLGFRFLELDYLFTCLIEVVILVLYVPEAANDYCAFKYNCLIIFKIFPCIIRYLRDHSPFFGAGGRLAGALSEVRVDGMYVIRLVMSQRPFASVMKALAMWVLITAYCLWCLERPLHPDDFDEKTLATFPSTFGRALWCTVITLATVGYGDIVPQTTIGCIMVIIGTLFGLILTAVIIHVVSEMLQAGEHQGRVLAFINERQTYEKERVLAASCIALFFRYVCKKRKEERRLKTRISEAPRLRTKRGSVISEGTTTAVDGSHSAPPPLVPDFKKPTLAKRLSHSITAAARKTMKRNKENNIASSKDMMNRLNVKLHQFRQVRRSLKHAAQFGKHKQTDFKEELRAQENLLKELLIFASEKNEETADRFDEMQDTIDELQANILGMVEKLDEFFKEKKELELQPIPI
jgi:hypothetical protein